MMSLPVTHWVQKILLTQCDTTKSFHTWLDIYIPVRHDMMRQTNDCLSVRVMQHKGAVIIYGWGVRVSQISHLENT